MNSDSVLRRLASLTSVTRTRDNDSVRVVRNHDPGRDARAAAAVAKIEEEVERLKTELGLP